MDQLFDVPVTRSVATDAVFSPCRRYRYSLIRRWEAGPLAVFVGCNPSRADEQSDDPTIRRCVRLARDWGFAGLRMVNLFAFVSPYPEDLLTVEDAVGARTAETLAAAAGSAGVVVAAWGSGSRDRRVAELVAARADEVVASGVLGDYRVLGLTAGGAPRHPLYMPASCRPLDPLTLESA